VRALRFSRLFQAASGAAVLAGFALTGDALAQSPHASALSQAPAESICTTCGRPTGIPAASPPAGFNPLTATDAQLDHYGFPPRPDPKSNPGAYAVWQTVVTAPVQRVIPRQQMTTLRNSPAVILSTSQNVRAPVTNSATGTTTPNWSGYGIIDSANPFKAAQSTIYGVFMVPVAQQAAGACTGGWDYSAAWVGFDGLNSKDLLQAGVEADAYCSGGSTKADYYGWYEWYPNLEVRVSAPGMEPGDLIYVYVWNTSPTTGHYYMQNMTQRKSSSLQFSAPSGYQLQGNSMEWIVERTQVGGKYATLTNYTAWPWYDARAIIPSGTKKLTYSPATAPSGGIYSITMLDDAGSAISYGETSGNNGFSYVDPQGKTHRLMGTGLWFFDEGSAK
jgi:Peptidase A4 family